MLMHTYFHLSIQGKAVNIIESLEHFFKDYMQEANKREMLLLPGKYKLKTYM